MDRSIILGILAQGSGCVCPELEELCRHENARTRAAEDAMEKALGLDAKSYTPTPEKLGLVEMMSELEASKEEIGFQNGFRVAVRLMAECMK